MPWGTASRQRLKKLFQEGFSVMDIAEPLVSFDAERSAADVHAHMTVHDLDLVGVRQDGVVTGYVMRDGLAGGSCGDHLVRFGPDDLVDESASIQKAIHSLGINGRCIVTVLDRPGAIVTLSDLEKPPVRMFLFGMITIFEMVITRMIAAAFPDEGWKEHVSEGRLAKARELHDERIRRNQQVHLLDCLQFSDKGQVFTRVPGVLENLQLQGINSRKEALRALKELESLRNNLAHTQEIIPSGWQRIITFSSRLEKILEAL